MKTFQHKEWLLIFLAIIFSLGVRLIHLERGWKQYHDLFFYEGRPLLVGMDAYYYLRLTRDLLEHRYLPHDELRAAPRLKPPPLLVVLSATLSRLSGVHIEWWAFFLPPLLASFLVVPLYLWGRVFGGPWGGFLTALLGAGTWYWYSRTPLGRFDTDCLLPFFIFIIPYLFFLMAQKGPSWGRISLLVILSLLFLWWWPPAKVVIFPLLLVSYGATCLLVSGKKRWWRLLALGGAFLSLGVLFLPLKGLSSEIASHLNEAKELLNMLLGHPIGPVKIQISELQPPDLTFLKKALGPHLTFVFLALGGLLYLITHSFRTFISLLFPLLLALLALWARRFFIYVVPFYALGLATLLAWPMGQLRTSSWRWLWALGALLLVGWNALPSIKESMLPVINRNLVSLVVTLQERTPPKTLVWCWWDYGYLVQYYAERPTFADGGFQQPWRVLALARPLGMRQDHLARAWIRLFAQKGPNFLLRLAKRWGWARTLQLLEEALLGQENQLSKFLRGPKSSKDVVLFLPYLQFRSASWARYSLWQGGPLPQATSKIIYDANPDLDTNKGILTVRQHGQHIKIPIYKALYLDFFPFPRVRQHFFFPKHREGLVWIRPLQALYSFLFDKRTSQSLAVRFLFWETNRLSQKAESFEMLIYQPLVGGVFKVLP